MIKEELIQKEAEELYNHFLSKPTKWRRKHNQYNNLDKCLNIIRARHGIKKEVKEVKVEQSQPQELKPKQGGFKFYGSKIKSRYNTYQAYLAARCESLPAQIERRFKNCSVQHIESRCRGMSNYIKVEKLDTSGEYVDLMTIRVSDHNSTGSGSPCEHYIYIQGKTWMEIKKEILEIVENFLK